jgi:hypothetical protein
MTTKKPPYFLHNVTRETWQLLDGNGSPLTAPRSLRPEEEKGWRVSVAGRHLLTRPAVLVVDDPTAPGKWIGFVADDGTFIGGPSTDWETETPTRAVITATVRGFDFTLRADWTDPNCRYEIEVGGYEWEETANIVGDWMESSQNPPTPALLDQGAAIGLPPLAIVTACSALVGSVEAHFDDYRADDLAAAVVLAGATLTAWEEGA